MYGDEFQEMSHELHKVIEAQEARIAELEELAWGALCQLGDWNEAHTEVDTCCLSTTEDLAKHFVKAGKLEKVTGRIYRVKEKEA